MNLRICCISDSHSRHKQLKIEQCDILLCSGDISMKGYNHEIVPFLDWFQRQPATWRVFCAGNHDLSFEKKESWLLELLSELDENTIYLQDSGCEIMRIKIYGSPWQPEFCNWAFNLPRGQKLAEKWAMIPGDTNILLTHGPLYGVDDRIPDSFRRGDEDPNVGCKDLLSRVKELPDLKLHVFGHIHQDSRPKIEPRIIEGSSATFVNASVLDNKYNFRYKPYYFDYEI